MNTPIQLCLLLFPLTLVAQPTIHLAAGGYLPPAGIAATSAQILPGAMASDGAGNLYFITHNRVYKRDSNGQLSVVAGTGAIGFTGDGGPAANATFRSLNGLALDGAGNLYINDFANHRIRKVNLASGMVSTVAHLDQASAQLLVDAEITLEASVQRTMTFDRSGKLFLVVSTVVIEVDLLTGASRIIAGALNQLGFISSGDGGPASDAQLAFPGSITSDGLGNVYFLDSTFCSTCFHPVRRINLASGTIDQWAPGTFFSAASAIAADPSGNIYVADSASIFRVNYGSNFPVQIAGTGTLGFSGDGGRALLANIGTVSHMAADGTNLYFDDGSLRIRQVTIQAVIPSAIINTVAGAGGTGSIGDGGPAANAFLGGPSAIAVDGSGNYFIADFLLHRVRRVDATTGNISTFAGSGSAGFSGDGNLAVNASFNGPGALAVDTSGNLYIADTGNFRIRKVDASTGKIQTVVGTGTSGFSGDGDLGTNAQLSRVFGIALDLSGNLLIADSFNNRVRRLSAGTGRMDTIAGNGTFGSNEGDGGPATAAALGEPLSVGVAPSGDIYIGINGTFIRKVNASNGIISTIMGQPGPSPTIASYPLTVSADSGMYFSSGLYPSLNLVQRYDTVSGMTTSIAGSYSVVGDALHDNGDGGVATGAAFNSIGALATGPGGIVYIGDGHVVRLIDNRPANAFAVTINSNLPSATLTVDGVNYSPPQTFNWLEGSLHSIGASYTAPSNATVNYSFTSLSNPEAFTVQVPCYALAGNCLLGPNANATLTATFTTQYLLRTFVSPSGNGIVRAIPGAFPLASAGAYYAAFYDAGTPVQVGASAYAGHMFTGFSGDLSGSQVPQTVTMNAAHTVTANFSTTTCTFNVSPTSATFGPNGGSGSLVVTTQPGCQWTASSSDIAFFPVQITSGASGTGNGTVNYVVAPLGDSQTPGASTFFSLLVAGQGIQIKQDFGSCFYLYGLHGLDSSAIPAAGASGTFLFNSQGCPLDWQIVADSNWAHLSPSSGTGVATLQYTFDANPGSTPRTINLSTGGFPRPFTQLANLGTLAVDHQTLSFKATTGGQIVTPGQSIAVTAPSGVNWDATSSSNFLTISPTLGNGSGTFSVSINPGGLPATKGTYSGSIVVSSPYAGNGAVTIPVTLQVDPPLSVGVSRSKLNFGATTNGQLITSGQSVLVTVPTGTGWNATSNSNFITLAPMSGTGSQGLSVGIDATQLPATSGTSTGTITIMSTTAGTLSATITVTLKALAPASVGLPFGSFDTPVTGTTGVVGAIPVTGWALDNIEVTRVDILREPVAGEPAGNLIFIGTAVFSADARPDVQGMFPTYPYNYRAGWGYQMLTNFLPQGNGTFKLHAIAYNKAGSQFDLGTKTIMVDNAHAAKPFGTIDTPGQGGTISGTDVVNFGWALTPQTATIPIDGSTITVVIDGQLVGHPTYNQFRSDVANLFPSFANSMGAVGFFHINTTTLANGVHTISWNAYDNQGRGEGLGSRYFSVSNTGGGSTAAPEDVIEPADSDGTYSVSMEEVGRIELHLGAASGNMLVLGEVQALPIGSSLKGGVFYWQPGPGFLGEYTMQFERPDGTKIPVRVNIVPKRYPQQ